MRYRRYFHIPREQSWRRTLQATLGIPTLLETTWDYLPLDPGRQGEKDPGPLILSQPNPTD